MKPEEAFEFLKDDLDSYKRQVTQALRQYAYLGRYVMFKIPPMGKPVLGEIIGGGVDFDARPFVKVRNTTTGKVRKTDPSNVIAWC